MFSFCSPSRRKQELSGRATVVVDLTESDDCEDTSMSLSTSSSSSTDNYSIQAAGESSTAPITCSHGHHSSGIKKMNSKSVSTAPSQDVNSDSAATSWMPPPRPATEMTTRHVSAAQTPSQFVPSQPSHTCVSSRRSAREESGCSKVSLICLLLLVKFFVKLKYCSVQRRVQDCVLSLLKSQMAQF